MPKYHVSPDGTPRICEATERGCPLGGDAPHGDFSSLSEAWAFAEKVNAGRYGGDPRATSKAPGNLRGSEEERRELVKALSRKDQEPRDDTVMKLLKASLKDRVGMDVVNETFFDRAYFTTATPHFAAEPKRVAIDVGEYVVGPGETDHIARLNIEYAESVLSNRLTEFMGDGPWRVKISVGDFVDE